MVAAQLTDLKRGSNQWVKDASDDATSTKNQISQTQAGKLMKVSKKSVERAKKVRKKGAPEALAAR